MTQNDRPAPADAPNPPAPPPLIFLVTFLTAYALKGFIPLTILPPGWSLIPAVLLSLGGLVIFASAAYALRRAGTPISPYKTSKKLVTTGPYLRTRNPIYLAFAWIYLGFASWTGSAWPFLLFPVLIYGMNRYVIVREEAWLEKRFGQAYREYKARARRWM